MWDDRIDEAARQLTEGSPAGDFQARVMSRIGRATEGGRQYDRRWRWALAPVAVAAAAVIAFMVPREPAVPPRQVPPPAVVQVVSPPPVGPEPAANRASAAASVAHEPSEPSIPRDPDELPFTITPIEVEPMVVDRIEADALPQTDAIVIDRLTIPLLQVRAFDAPLDDIP